MGLAQGHVVGPVVQDVQHGGEGNCGASARFVLVQVRPDRPRVKRAERRVAADKVATLRRWGGLAHQAVQVSDHVAETGKAARLSFEQRRFTCQLDGHPVQLLPVFDEHDLELGHQLRAARLWPEPDAEERVALGLSSPSFETSLAAAGRVLTSRRHFMGSEETQAAHQHLNYVVAQYDRGQANGWEHLLTALSARDRPREPEPGSLPDVTFEAAGAEGRQISHHAVEQALEGMHAVRSAHAAATRAAKSIRDLGVAVRSRDVRVAMEEMPLAALKSATSGRLRLGAVERAGITSVQDVLNTGIDLQRIDGVGEQSVRQIVAAAETMQSLTRRETPVRIDVSTRDYRTRQLLQGLRVWADTSTALREATEVIESTDALMGCLAAQPSAKPPSHYVVESEVVASLVSGRLRDVADLQRVGEVMAANADPWHDFLARPADYLGWLAEFGFLTEDAAAAQGQLSDELIERVRSQDLDTSFLRHVSLRGYQDFGARFVLVQRKVIIGDEMGLGKTIEALAVLGHVHAKGGTHSIVVCPASVVSNWMREIQGRSVIDAYRLHGKDRWDRAHLWARRGGVAVTTFETLKSLQDVFEDVAEVHGVVVDEAHYIKNPAAQRTRLSRVLIDRADRALLLTGTPIENRLEEFENLVSYVQPRLFESLGAGYTPKSFPRLIAPAYLRRNQEDVLTELPERIDVEEWLPMSARDDVDYTAAVVEGNFMAMRRAALLTGERSEKLRRLDEIVAEARSNHRKVIVFSYFRDVLGEVIDRLGGDVLGPVTGSVAASQRQLLVDEFTKAPSGAVLVSQISAGGVGLNIQAGSVVIICEPQVKPSMESQAVARAHRMGQTETVQVHRLLSDEGVDRRMVEILAEKQKLFDEFARVSHTADSAPEAFDITEADLAREVIAAERERLARRSAMAHDQSTLTEETA